MFRLLSVLILLIIIAGCGDIKDQEDKEFQNTSSIHSDKFFIQISPFSEHITAIKNAQNIKKHNSGNVYIDTLNHHSQLKNYIVSIGPYEDAYSAGKQAYYLYENKLISEYVLTKDNKEITDPFLNIIFIALNDSLPALYYYNILTNESRLFWQQKKEKILELSPSKNQSFCFLITASGYGESASFPYIKKARLFHISVQDESIREIYNFGDGLQLYAFWISKNLFKVSFNYLHPLVANSVVEQSIVFNFSGNLLSEETKYFDLIKEDYPTPSLDQLEISSPDAKYTLLEISRRSESAYYISNNRSQKRSLIYTGSQTLKKAEWTEDNDYIIFSTTNIIQKRLSNRTGLPDSSEILIYSLEQNKITKQWKSKGNKNFFLRGDIIFLDYHSGNESSIEVYDFRNDKKLVSIKRTGGCGFSSLSQLSENGEK